MQQTVANYPVLRRSRTRQFIASALSVLIIPFASGGLYGQGYAPLDPVGLDRLVAPIALYPDSLVAQILTAATFPQQVSEAANWVNQTNGMPPQQRADEANNMPWDPSVKALTAFPSVLDNLARNTGWTSSLGNAYYNQPGDVMNAVQAMRVQAQQAGQLRSTPQERVYYDDGQVLIAPVNPEVVYVPYYDPWRIYGAGFITPYPGFYLSPGPPGWAVGLGIGFVAGVSIGLFGHYGWGYNSWAPNWRGGVVVYNHNTYISNSTTVINRGNFGSNNRGVFEHGGQGVPANFRPPVTNATARFTPGGNVNRPGNTFNRPAAGAARPSGDFANRGVATRPQNSVPQNQVRTPAPGGYRTPAPQARTAPARPAPPQERVAPQVREAPQNHAAPQVRQAPPSHPAPAAHGGEGHEEHGHH